LPDDGTDWEDEEEFPGRPFGPKPFGPKPFGPKPFGPKQFGTRPFGPKPFGPKPFGPKPFGPKPFGPKAGGADEADGGSLDLDEWSAEIAELVCGRSAVLRLGATLVAPEQGVVPEATFDVQADYRAPGKPEPAVAEVPEAADEPSDLRPAEWRLSAGVAVSRRVVRAVAESPELAYTLVSHLAEALAVRADKTFLQGKPGDEPKGIAHRDVNSGTLDADLLITARKMVTAVRESPHPFRNPGWVFAATTLDTLTGLVTADGLSEGGDGARSLDSYRLLQLDGIDGGVFLGFPFVLSAGAEANIYFAADWQEAWIGVAPHFVSVSAEPASRDEIVFRASMPLDFALRTTDGFAVRGPDLGST
jgi:Phage capsid family